ncbi:hypothetical protein HFC70_25435 [Agrobacterium sp. a22-2]|uniref:hypothetical protein n=1 Tax=Agrobacterium sp. a22-2 TaxID=2283840 RepID=UPI0014461E1A|nr:hypothetical protein [Agrobacterium sp. a22-2]NKN39697.1 hypothetical protein [Agrobacterium sp. a22-2]
MTKLQELEQTVLDLDGDEFAAFTRWFEQLQARRLDERIDTDIEKGALDALGEKALSDFRAGRTRTL